MTARQRKLNSSDDATCGVAFVMAGTGEPYAGESVRGSVHCGCRVVVVVRREGRWWFAEVAAVGVVRTRSLHSAVRRVRQLVGDVPVRYQFHTGDAELDRLVIQIR